MIIRSSFLSIATKQHAPNTTLLCVCTFCFCVPCLQAILFYSGNPARYCEATTLEEQQADAPVEEVPIYDDNGTIIGYNETAVEEEERSISEILVCPGMGASVSWWFLFVGVRQVATFSLALLTQALVIDFWALGSRFFLSW